MRGGDTVAGVLGCIAIYLMAIALGSAPSHAAGLATEAQDVEGTTALVREIQFMLLRLGMDPGPIDGIAGPQTVGAAQDFKQNLVYRPRIWSMTGKFQPSSWRGCAAKLPESFSAGEKRPESAPGGRNALPGCGGAGPAAHSAA